MGSRCHCPCPRFPLSWRSRRRVSLAPRRRSSRPHHGTGRSTASRRRRARRWRRTPVSRPGRRVRPGRRRRAVGPTPTVRRPYPASRRPSRSRTGSGRRRGTRAPRGGDRPCRRRDPRSLTPSGHASVRRTPTVRGPSPGRAPGGTAPRPRRRDARRRTGSLRGRVRRSVSSPLPPTPPESPRGRSRCSWPRGSSGPTALCTGHRRRSSACHTVCRARTASRGPTRCRPRHPSHGRRLRPSGRTPRRYRSQGRSPAPWGRSP